LFVRFHDGVRKKATLFASNPLSRHVILKANSSRHRACVHFTTYPVRRQNIFTMAAVEAADGIGLMSGTVRYICVFHLKYITIFLGFSSF
jgi:hypothetical protein